MFDIITIGTATRDVFLTSKFFKVLKDPVHLKQAGFKTDEAQCFALGSKIEIDKPFLASGGGAANAAVTFSHFGFKTAALIRIGNDSFGESIISDLKKEKIIPLVVKDKKLNTAYSTVLLSSGGERTILVYRGAAGTFYKPEIPFPKLKAKWAYISPGEINVFLMEQIITYLKKSKTKIAMNPSKYYLNLGLKKLRKILSLIDAVIVNREEASYLTGRNYNDEKGIFKKFDELAPGVAVMTDGKDGAFVSDGKFIYQAGIFKEKKLIDRTGAGDAFGSAFIAGLMMKNDIKYALRLASANAASVVEHLGAQAGILRKQDIKNPRWKKLRIVIKSLSY